MRFEDYINEKTDKEFNKKIEKIIDDFATTQEFTPRVGKSMVLGNDTYTVISIVKSDQRRLINHFMKHKDLRVVSKGKDAIQVYKK
jgi:hypothetical protein